MPCLASYGLLCLNSAGPKGMLGGVAAPRTAVVLAGGRSRRMGAPKAWLEVAGTTLLQRIVAELGKVCSAVVVVGSKGDSLPALPASCVRVDDAPGTDHAGPLQGVAAGLAQLPGSALVYLSACDMPWVDAAHVEFMFERLEHRQELAAVVPQTEDPSGKAIVHGLASAVRCAPALVAIQELLATDARALKRLFAELACERVSAEVLPNPAVLGDCNDPEQWAAAVRSLITFSPDR